jgi:membrane-associated phospholipid phosphatase
MSAIDAFYVLAHVAVTIGVLVWIYLRHREHYPFVRNLIMLTTTVALVSFYVYPTAPPRMLSNYGFVDPLQLHHLVAAGGAQPSSYTYNPYAAMPSLHVGYALVVAWGVFIADRRLWVRGLAAVYPFAMGAAVIISGNHWVLDVVGAFATVLASGVALLAIQWLVGWAHGYRLKRRYDGRSGLNRPSLP